jgi:hypothetical protein
MGTGARIAYTVAAVGTIVFNALIVRTPGVPYFEVIISAGLALLTVWLWTYAIGWSKEYHRRSKLDKTTFQLWSVYFFFSLPFSGIRWWNRLEHNHLSLYIMIPAVLIAGGLAVMLTGVIIVRMVLSSRRAHHDNSDGPDR